MAPQTFKDLFGSDSYYEIPDYQRSYAWRKEPQLNQFLADLEEQPAGKDYYLGHFLFKRRHATKPHFDVIDGQQRITTIVIFISALIQQLEQRQQQGEELRDSEGIPVEPRRLEERYLQFYQRPRLRTVAFDHSYFEQAVLYRHTGVQPNKGRKSQRLMREALQLFSERMEATPTDTLLRWLELIEGATITHYEVTGDVQATQIFAFQNDRGIKLTALEQLKAYLMHRAYLDAAEDDAIHTIKHVEARFGEMYKLSDEIKLGEDTVFSYHNTAFGRGHDAFKGVKEAIKAEAPSSRAMWIRQYVDRLMESFEAVKALETRAKDDSFVTGVLHLDAGASWPLLLRIQREMGGDEAKTEGFFRLMEIILFKKAYSVSSYRSNDFHELARTYQGEEALRQRLIERAENGFQWYWSFTGDFKRRLEGNHHYHPDTRYLLWQYENHLRRQAKRPIMSGAEFKNTWGRGDLQQTLDHIAPQNGSYTPEFEEAFLHNLGNLALMPQGPNSRKRDTRPEEAEAYQSSTNLADQEVGEAIRSAGAWSEQQITDRAARIRVFAEKFWLSQL